MRILLTNDDGFEAPGIAALEKVASQFGETLTVAPRNHLSGCGHQVTLDNQLELTELDATHFHLNGMPADCVRIAVAHFGTFDWVFSGINQGANLGVDLTISGTVAAAREASQIRIPAIALSQYRQKMSPSNQWDTTIVQAERVLKKLLQQELQPGKFWNVNFPDTDESLPAILNCPVDSLALPLDYESSEAGFRFSGDYHGRQFESGTDVEACFGGNISISCLG